MQEKCWLQIDQDPPILEHQQLVLEDLFLDVALLTAQIFDNHSSIDVDSMEDGRGNDFHSVGSERHLSISIKLHIFCILDGEAMPYKFRIPSQAVQ